MPRATPEPYEPPAGDGAVRHSTGPVSMSVCSAGYGWGRSDGSGTGRADPEGVHARRQGRLQLAGCRQPVDPRYGGDIAWSQLGHARAAALRRSACPFGCRPAPIGSAPLRGGSVMPSSRVPWPMSPAVWRSAITAPSAPALPRPGSTQREPVGRCHRRGLEAALAPAWPREGRVPLCKRIISVSVSNLGTDAHAIKIGLNYRCAESRPATTGSE